MSILSPIPPVSPGQRRARIVVVDDQPANLMLLYQLLSDDYELLAATNGQQALALCRQAVPDLVLLDVAMPELDGLEVCKRLKQSDDTAAIPVVFVTGGASEQEENACWDAGGADFVNKPVNPTTLRQRIRVQVQLKRQLEVLQALAFNDGLTGIANRRHVDGCIQQEWRRCGRAGASLALLMIDIDHFKLYNDHYGHLAGDACLIAVARAVTEVISRPGDLAGRYGGEEFICLLPDTDLAGASLIGQRVEAIVRARQILHAASTVAPVVTVSIGAAAMTPDTGEAAQLVGLADAALYRAKLLGRAQVQTCGAPGRAEA